MRLREIRKSNNLTLKELGEKVGVSKSMLSEIENSKEHVSFDTAIRIADYLCVSLDYLIGRSDNLYHQKVRD